MFTMTGDGWKGIEKNIQKLCIYEFVIREIILFYCNLMVCISNQTDFIYNKEYVV